MEQKGAIFSENVLSVIKNCYNENEVKKMYRIMFSDLDETLLVNHHVPEVNREAILKARAQGLKFVPCTGRAFNMIPEILKEIGTYDQEGEYSLCFNGGLIVENKNGKVLHFKGLEYEKAKKVFDFAEKLDVCVMVFTLDYCYLFHAHESEIQRKTAQKAPFKVVEDFDMSFLKNDHIAKILLEKGDMSYLKAIEKKLPEDIVETCSIGFSSGRYLEINAQGIDKGYGIRWLTDYLGYSLDETIGIGDNYNDVEMIKTAKLGVAVACAQDDIKALAQYVTVKDYDEGAVQEVIEKFVLGNQDQQNEEI